MTTSTAPVKSPAQVQAESMLKAILESETGFCGSQDGNFGRLLSEMLSKEGFKYYETLSTCKVASFENTLKKGNKKVEIEVSNFMGVFTQVSLQICK